MGVLLPLFLAIPLASSAVAILAPWQRFRECLALIVPCAGIFAGGWLYVYTRAHGPMAHNVGLYPGGVAIPFLGDAFSALMIVATSLVVLIATWYAIQCGETRARFYPALTLMLYTGVCGALLTADLFNFFVMMEIMLVPSYALLAMTGTQGRLRAGRLFIVTNLFASTLLVVGVAFVYGSAGAVNIAALAGAARDHGSVVVALSIVVVALAMKAAVFPLHTWLPRTYPSSSASVMALFSGLHTKIAVYMLFRIAVVIFSLSTRWNSLLTLLLVISMLVGAFSGLGEHTLRRVISYQMVAGMPFILLMVVFSGDTVDSARAALSAGIFYMLHHMVTIAALVVAAGALEATYRTGRLSKLSGVMRRDPLLSAVFAAGAFSIVGFPPFSGVWGKVFVVVTVARSGGPLAWVVLAAMVLASLGVLLSMLRVWREVFWGRPMQATALPPDLISARVPVHAILPAAVLMLVSCGMFVFIGPISSVIDSAASSLLDVPAYVHAVLGSSSDAVAVGDPDIFLPGGHS